MSKIQIRKDELKKEIRKNLKEINRRYKAGDTDGLDFFKRYREYFKELTGTESKSQSTIALGKLSKYSLSTLSKINKIQKDFLKSSWSTVEGREAIIAKAFDTFEGRHSGATKSSFLKMIDLLNNDTIQRLREIKGLSSSQIEDLARKDKTPQQVIDAVTSVMNRKDFSRLKPETIEKYIIDKINKIR